MMSRVRSSMSHITTASETSAQLVTALHTRLTQRCDAHRAAMDAVMTHTEMLDMQHREGSADAMQQLQTQVTQLLDAYVTQQQMRVTEMMNDVKQRVEHDKDVYVGYEAEWHGDADAVTSHDQQQRDVALQAHTDTLDQITTSRTQHAHHATEMVTAYDDVHAFVVENDVQLQLLNKEQMEEREKEIETGEWMCACLREVFVRCPSSREL